MGSGQARASATPVKIQLTVEFADQPGSRCIVWVFSIRICRRILRCHIAALEVIGGKPGEISVRSLENRGPRRGYGPSRGL